MTYSESACFKPECLEVLGKGQGEQKAWISPAADGDVPWGVPPMKDGTGNACMHGHEPSALSLTEYL